MKNLINAAAFIRGNTVFAKFASIANFYGPPHCFVLCLVGDCGNIVIFAIFAKFASIANFYGPPHCFVLCPVGDSGKIVIFAIFAKFAIMFSFLPFLLLRAFLDISDLPKKLLTDFSYKVHQQKPTNERGTFWTRGLVIRS